MKPCPRALPLALLLALGVAAPVAGQEPEAFVVTGPGLVGRAVLHRTPQPGVPAVPVMAELDYRVFRGDASTRTRRVAHGLLLPSGVLELVDPPGAEGGTAVGAAGRVRGLDGGGGGAPTGGDRVQLQPDALGYRGTVAGLPQRWRRAPRTDGLVVLLVPGLSTNLWNQHGIPYFDANRDALRALGLEAYRIGTDDADRPVPGHPFSTQNSVADNARAIAREIRTQAAFGKRVILFAHSKGATDATAAVALEPDLIPHLAGLVAIQPVYGGSAIADLAAHDALTLAGVRLALEGWAGGSRDAVVDLTRARRRAFVRDHPYPSDRVPTVVLRSSFSRSLFLMGRTPDGRRLRDPAKRLFQRALRFNQRLISRRTGEDNDGMVTLGDQRIPGAVHLDVDDLDHFEPGLGMLSPHRPADLSVRLLEKLFALLERR
ncbi:MAG: hypothetical protein D6731_22175 [Planctomycetota bacterium]|nr:MAG: hypothetical protein D6731_22175 [Planctomycetota bacterium]